MQDKLDFCPFCGGEAHLVQTGMPDRYRVECSWNALCFAHRTMVEYLDRDVAISAWNRRATQPNEPLTLKEVSQYITGKPILLSTIDGSHTEWKIVEGFDFDEEHDQICYTDGQHSKLSTYGKTWLAYRTKPEVAE